MLRLLQAVKFYLNVSRAAGGSNDQPLQPDLPRGWPRPLRHPLPSPGHVAQLGCGKKCKINCLSLQRESFFLPGTGFVEYVESRSVASVVSEYGGILKYLDSLATKKKGARSVVADFTKSCGEFWRLAPFLCVRSLPALITFK